MAAISLILANLTEKEYARFMKSKVGYSGATGAYALPDHYDGLAPYIASFLWEAEPALRALRWRNFSVSASSHQWIVRKSRAHRRQQ